MKDAHCSWYLLSGFSLFHYCWSLVFFFLLFNEKEEKCLLLLTVFHTMAMVYDKSLFMALFFWTIISNASLILICSSLPCTFWFSHFLKWDVHTTFAIAVFNIGIVLSIQALFTRIVVHATFCCCCGSFILCNIGIMFIESITNWSFWATYVYDFLGQVNFMRDMHMVYCCFFLFCSVLSFFLFFFE